MIVGNDMGRVLPMAVFGIAAVVASLLSLMLTETKFRRFPDQMGDFEKYVCYFSWSVLRVLTLTKPKPRFN